MQMLNRTIKTISTSLCILFILGTVSAQTRIVTRDELKEQFLSPPPSASPWVFWYWNQASVSREGITADLEAMKQSGIGGAYLMTIKDSANPPLMKPVTRQLTPGWWKMIGFAMAEAKRLKLKLAMHVSDGFALAGGPWITPERSMQKVVWTKTLVRGGSFKEKLHQPETVEGYYKDIAVFAYPSPEGSGINTQTVKPKVTSSKGDSIAKLLSDPDNKRNFSSDEECWIQYEFEKPFTCRSVIIRSRNNFQSNRLMIEVSDDGKSFRSIGRLEPPRTGWQDWDADYTHSIVPETAKFFRFIYDKTGTEPGSEDIDAAKWRPSLKITGIELSSEPQIHQYEGKNGEVWRVSKRTTAQQLPANVCVPLKRFINISKYLDKNGKLVWQVPPGNWTIIRIGHTSTGHKNDTGGGGKGLECDKFDPAAIKIQFDNWFGNFYKKAGPALTTSVIKIFHVDSWECGSQNWSPVFRSEFKKRRGYDLLNYLPVMAGIPVQSAEISENFLHDVRQTIADLVADNFYVTLNKLAHAKGCTFTAESVAPTMLSDGMLHYKNVDIPMGEFWLRSPTHDKPNDMLDAISAAHVYGKNIIQAEAFTQLRTVWDEHPGNLKTLQDRNYAMGINRLTYHVFMHNPWMDRKPGMTLDGIGLFFQRDQTWWKQGKAWVDYARRCQALLQIGKPVVDIAVFTGEELPRRSVLPDRLVSALPGIFGKQVVEKENKRLQNVGQPMEQSPPGVTHLANMAYAQDWTDPLRGYAYDSYNPDALQHSKVVNGKIKTAGGAEYKLLVLPGVTKMDPDGAMSDKVAMQLKAFLKQGTTIISKDSYNNLNTDSKGILFGPYTESSFEKIGLEKDLIASDAGVHSKSIAWTHRAAPGLDIYFISNQNDQPRIIDVSLRVTGRIPELWDAVTGNISPAKTWRFEKGRTVLPVRLEANGSVFIVMQKPSTKQIGDEGMNWIETKPVTTINTPWSVSFDPAFGGPDKPVIFNELTNWSEHPDSSVRYYSGTAKYTNTFAWQGRSNEKVWLDVGKVSNIAEVIVNGINCGVVWTPPYKVDITKAIRKGSNNLTIEVTNTWANRIIGDHRLPEEKRITKTNAPFRLEGKPLLEAGLMGQVVLEIEK